MSDPAFSYNYGCARPQPADLLPLQATKLFSFADKLDGRRTIRLDVGPNDDPLVSLGYFLQQAKIYPRIKADKNEVAQDQDVLRANVELLRSNLAHPKIVHFRDGKFIEVILEGRGAQIPPVQPFGVDHYLLTNVVVNREGVTLERFDLGCCLQTIQTTREGNIWTYYGEDVIYGGDPIGRKIVACFDRDGKHQYPAEYNEKFEYWCTALNVESDSSVWFAPTMGSLVQVENFAIKTVTRKLRVGLGVFAIHAEHAFWAPSEDDSMGVDFFVASNLNTGKNKLYQAVDENGNRLDHELYAARGSRMYFTVNHDVYVIDMKDTQF